MILFFFPTRSPAHTDPLPVCRIFHTDVGITVGVSIALFSLLLVPILFHVNGVSIDERSTDGIFQMYEFLWARYEYLIKLYDRLAASLVRLVNRWLQ